MAEAEMTVAAQAAVEQVGARLRRHFRRPETHRHACADLRGLLGGAERKHGWQLAEETGYAQPRSVQRAPPRSVWDMEMAGDDLRAFVAEQFGDPEGVVVLDETGFLKQGCTLVGVKRQDSGPAARIENCQIGVFLAHATATGRVGLDRSLSPPHEWATDAARRTAAGVPKAVGFQTKRQRALAMLLRALDGGVSPAWVTAVEVYGNDFTVRHGLEARGQASVSAVRHNQTVSRWPPHGLVGQRRVETRMADADASAWQRLRCGTGAQGERRFDWLTIPLRPALVEGWTDSLLVRRHRTAPDELAYCLVYARDETPLIAIVRAAGRRWAVEDTFKLAKGQVGLDH